VRDKLGKDINFIVDGMAKDLGLEPAAIDRLTLVFPQIGPGGPVVMMYIAASKTVDKKHLLARTIPGAEEKKHAGQTYFANERRAALFLDDRHYVLANVGDIQTLIDDGKAKPDGSMVPGLKLAAGKHSAVLAINPEQIDRMADELPADAEPIKPLLKAKFGTLALDVGDRVKAQLRVTFPGRDQATAGSKALEAMRTVSLGQLKAGIKQLEKAAEMEPFVKLLQHLERELTAAKVAQDGVTLAVRIDTKLEDKTVATVLGEGVVKMRQAALRMQGMNNLKQIGLAMHNYHDLHRSLPPQAVYDKDGKALLSWRVLLLPFIEQDGLYKEFKLNEPWDSPHNKKLLAKMPPVYKLPGAKPKHQYGTYYQVFIGKDAAFEGKTGLALTAFTDGTSNTILLAEAAKDVPWTKPEDIPFDAGKEVPRLGGTWTNGFQTLFADGSVRFLSNSINKDTLKAMITRNGGEVIQND
jgi:hypothetical protein